MALWIAGLCLGPWLCGVRAQDSDATRREPTSAQPTPATVQPTAPPKEPATTPREPSFAEFVPASANFFLNIRNLRTLDAAFRRVHAWRLLSSWPHDEDNARSLDLRTALEALLGPKTSINLNEFMEAEVAIVAADAFDVSHLLWLVRTRDPTAIERWFPPDHRLARHEYPSAYAFRMDNGLVVTVRGNVFAMGRRWTGDSVLVDTMRLLQGTGGANLGADPEYRALVRGLPGGLLATATFLLNDADAKGDGDGRASLLPIGGRVMLGLSENRGGLDVLARGSAIGGTHPVEVDAATVTRLLSLPSTTIVATASTISGAEGADVSTIAQPFPALARYVRILDALHRAGPRGETPLPRIGPGFILAWDQDLEGTGASPQAAVLVQCAEAARLAEELRSIAVDFSKFLAPAGSNDRTAPEIVQRSHLGTAYQSLPLSGVAQASTHPLVGLLRGAELSWAAADDWLIVSLSPDHLERIIEARAGLVLPLRSVKEAPRLGSHQTDYRFVAIAQPAAAADVLEQWLRRIDSREPEPSSAGSTPNPSPGEGVPDDDIGFSIAADDMPGAAVIASVRDDSVRSERLLAGDVVLGVDGQLLALSSPDADLRRRLLTGGGPAGKILRVQRGETVLDIPLPSMPAARPTLDETGPSPLDAFEDLASAARAISVATFALEGGDAARYSARLSLRFVPLPQESKRAGGN